MHIADIYKLVGSDVGFLVDAVTKNRQGFYKKNELFEDGIERLLWAGMQDVRSLLLKISDREHNMITVQHIPDYKQIRMFFETQAIYLPLVRVLGYHKCICLDEVNTKFCTLLRTWNIHDSRRLKEKLTTYSFEHIMHYLDYYRPEY